MAVHHGQVEQPQDPAPRRRERRAEQQQQKQDLRGSSPSNMNQDLSDGDFPLATAAGTTKTRDQITSARSRRLRASNRATNRKNGKDPSRRRAKP